MDAKSAIVRIDHISGLNRTDLSLNAILSRVAEEARAWPPDLRPGFRDDMVSNGDFVLIDPKHAEAALFPRVFWCQNRACGAVFDRTSSDQLPPATCSVCKSGSVRQLRWVQFHRCGDLRALQPPYECRACHGTKWKLDLRGSERLGSFRWVCANPKCQQATPIFAGACRACAWPVAAEQRADIDVHRSSRVYYTQTTTLLNVPNRAFEALIGTSGNGPLVAAKYLDLPEAAEIKLSDMAGQAHPEQSAPSIKAGDLDELLAGGAALDVEELKRRLLERLTPADAGAKATGSWAEIVETRTGVVSSVWDAAAPRLLDALLPRESGRFTDILPTAGSSVGDVGEVVADMGLKRVTLLPDFPILTVSYGFTRGDFQPGRARLNVFPPDRDLGGKTPIFVDQVGADAIVLSLDEARVATWLAANGIRAALPPGTGERESLSAYFVAMMTGKDLRQTIPGSDPATRMTFGLLHTISHLAIRQAGVLSGLDRTSLAEYLLPQALGAAVFCSHRFGATIGALTALFEDTASQWLGLIRDSSRCVYDPVCRESTGSCHACVHLAETSCRFFNLNLSRSFLFGGPDQQLGEVRIGYLDPSLGSMPSGA